MAEPSDTRPISILPAITKLVERIVQKQLVEYLESNQLFADSQHGYRKNFSTESALHVITDAALQAMDKGEISILVLLDLSKCFDVIPHAKLLQKMTCYGIETDWFSSYLRGHTQQVQMSGHETGAGRGARGICRAGVACATVCVCEARGQNLSKIRDVKTGIFQGGALSCILYALFANDLSLCFGEGVTTVCYADDTSIMVSGKKRDIHLVIARIEAVLTSAYQWFCHNGMKINTQKTQMVVIGTQAMLRDLPPVSINFLGSIITESRQVKSLGVTIDRHLTFEPHIDAMTKKCFGILIGLNHAKHVIPHSALKIIVESLTLSIVRYCISVYGSCGVTQLRRVQKVINFCARVVTGRRRHDHISDAVQNLGWLTAEQLVSYHTVCSIVRIVSTRQPPYLLSTIGARRDELHGHNTRGASQRALPHIRTEAGRRRLCYRGVSLLNALGLEPGSEHFRTALRTWIQLMLHDWAQFYQS